MKVLVVHNLHRKGSASGDDQVFKAETDLLENNNIGVIKYTAINDQFDNSNILNKILMTVDMFWSNRHYKNIDKIIKANNPDIMHVHTFFPLLSPSIFYAAKKNNLKVVSTMHDTRLVCPCATSLCKSRICNKCCDGKYFRMIKYSCFKDSKVQSFVVALIFYFHRYRKTFYTKIDKYICLNDEQINMLKKAGYADEKIVKKYNFVEEINFDDKKISVELPERYVLFYGRLGEEKGIDNLMRIWDEIDDIPLVVMGTGPLEVTFKKWSEQKNNVWYLGYVDHSQCMKIVANSEFVILPSICYEGCSMAFIETESIGKPIITHDIGFFKEAVVEGYNGFKVKLNDVNDYITKITNLWNDKELLLKMKKNTKKDYLDKYTSKENINQLINIYENTINKVDDKI